jgi:zona occludens toxin (predicted ATPase)
MNSTDSTLPNGGFPPIKKCNNIKENTPGFTKERFAPGYKTNINITKILNTNIKKPILLEEINEIELIDEV